MEIEKGSSFWLVSYHISTYFSSPITPSSSGPAHNRHPSCQPGSLLLTVFLSSQSCRRSRRLSSPSSRLGSHSVRQTPGELERLSRSQPPSESSHGPGGETSLMRSAAQSVLATATFHA
ncbi:hypothetical protein HPP92_028765 [Vanilla planifolia]|uniref:Uncharacterized protein n=1 Tax=Vanilla planifolia TaxID=51239 RepID=A0A835P7B8_VANPL|nr:hypothetical protein HPP92_028765 [Vanilla planifolia]KAG0446610.1 hypothetical protein HPP92_028751 [Vanilla planifolia]